MDHLYSGCWDGARGMWRASRSARSPRSPSSPTCCSCNPARIQPPCSKMRSFRRNRQRTRRFGETGKGCARSDDEAGGSDGQHPGSRDGPAPAAGRSRIRPGAGQGHRAVRLADARGDHRRYPARIGAPRLLRRRGRWSLWSQNGRCDPRFRAGRRPQAEHGAKRGAAAGHGALAGQADQGDAAVRRCRDVRRLARAEAAVDRPAPSKRVIALQRALAEYGYGQIRPSGIIDAETQAAIEKFERERKLPITGQASERVVRELAAMTGRPLE